VIEHEILHPSTTILTTDDLFSFCTMEYTEDFTLFSKRAEEQIAHCQEQLILEDKSGQDDLLFMTSIPWVSFTSFTHPTHLHPSDSVPRFAWGKFYQDGERLLMPLSVQGHHALMDGIHMGKFYAEVQDNFNHPDFILSENVEELS
jgi:chloramphenicol O-acetyltransferase type A